MARNLIASTGLAAHFSNTQKQNDELFEEITRIHRKGLHMEILERAIQENPLMQDAWNKVMLTLRLCGYDQ
jgi:hypothetical protein